MTAPDIIPLDQHPHNLDPTATLVTTDRESPGIYKVRTGYIACLREQLCFAETFPSKEVARQAQIGYG